MPAGRSWHRRVDAGRSDVVEATRSSAAVGAAQKAPGSVTIAQFERIPDFSTLARAARISRSAALCSAAPSVTRLDQAR